MAVGRIIVGVDGSVGSLRVLEWAAAEAALSNRPLVVVHAYTDPTLMAASWPPVPVLSTPEEIEAEHRAELDRCIEEVLKPDVQADRVVVRSDAVRALVERAGPDDLLVVGHHQHLAGGLGSVARRVVGHAPCPVVVVPQR